MDGTSAGWEASLTDKAGPGDGTGTSTSRPTTLPPPFIIYSLPRSRSFWLSRLLTYGPWVCGHDQIRYGRSLRDVASWFDQGYAGTVETAAAPFWRLAPSTAKVVTIRRDPEEVMWSLLALDLPFDTSALRHQLLRLDAKLDQIEARVPGVLRVGYRDLDLEDCCAEVFEHCLGLPHDPDWYRATAQFNLQVSLPHYLRYAQANQTQLAIFAGEAKARILRGFTRVFSQTELAGMSYQQEPFSTAWPAAQELLSANCTASGLLPDEYLRMDHDLMREYAAAGQLFVTTARSNGRMFGYLMTQLTRSLEDKGQMIAIDSSFYVSPSCPGAGRKLKNLAALHAAELGTTKILLRAGVRGDGPRLGAMYLRSGAEPHGMMYMKNLTGV